MKQIRNTIELLHSHLILLSHEQINEDVEKLVKSSLARIDVYEECNVLKDFTIEQLKELKKAVEVNCITHYKNFYWSGELSDWYKLKTDIIPVGAPDTIIYLPVNPLGDSHRVYRMYWYPSIENEVDERGLSVEFAAVRLSNGREYTARDDTDSGGV